MGKLYKLIGENPNYSRIVELYNPEVDENIPEWLQDILKPEKLEECEIKYKIVRSKNVTEYYLDVGGVIVVPKGSILTWSGKSIGVMSIDAFNILYSEVNNSPWYVKLLNKLKHLH